VADVFMGQMSILCIKTLVKAQSTDSSQGKSSAGPILSSSITGFLAEGSFLPLCCLSSAVLDGVQSPHAKGNF